MVRLWTLPNGRVVEQVFVREDAATVDAAGAKLAGTLPVGTTFEDFSNDAYEALVPRTAPIGHWRRQGNAIIVDPPPAPPHPRQPVLDEITAATTLDALKAAVLKALR